MVNERRNTAVGVEFGMLGTLLLVLAEIEEDGLVIETEFLQDDENFPVDKVRVKTRVKRWI